MTAALLVLCLGAASASALDFPPLTGRVVDQAGILNPDIRGDLADKSKDFEEKSGIQLVVATVTSLQGSDIETYANELFRTWKLGQAQKNNGVLLLVAPNERKVRIEVGYGLEGTLTDAVASVIISSAIVPRFKNGDFPGGIERGVGGILDVLGGDTADWQPQAVVRDRRPVFPVGAFPDHSGSIGFVFVVRLYRDWYQAALSRPALRRLASGAGGPLCQARQTSGLCFRQRLELFELGQFVEQQFVEQQLIGFRFFRRRRVVGRWRRIR